MREDNNDAGAILDAGTALAGHAVVEEGGAPYIIVPDGYVVKDMTDLLLAPVRRKGHASLADQESFIRYVDAFKREETALFATTTDTGCSIVAIFDYVGKIGTSWNEDRASYTPEYSREWKLWTSKSGNWLPQQAFAEYLEHNLIDVAGPPAADVLEAARNLSAKKSANFKSAVNLQNGDTQFAFEETTEAKAGAKGVLSVPSEIYLGIPIFKNGPKYEVRAFLRYRINDGALTFMFDIVKPEKLIQAATEEIIKAVAEGTEIQPYMGKA